ncbi:MAG: hypothetical protein Q4F21_13640, partial [Lachnospiraceae bacterium]|nr:hypothetical protein [Lachnospiraceae bacterium]
DTEAKAVVKEKAETKTEVKEKAEAKAARTPVRAKRGRPPKKERTENLPEIKIVITASDVVAKCEAAEGAEWTGEVVRLINQSRDKKELYAAIVKLLGQEKGRTVYHAIKVLK